MKLISVFRGIATALLCACLSLSALGASSESEGQAPAVKAAKPAASAPSKSASSPKTGEKEKKAPSPKKEKAPAGEKPDEEKKEKEDSPPAIHPIKKGEFELKVDLEGVFEAAQATPISVNPEEWSDLTVIDVLPHGTMVKKGDVLIRFDTEKLREEIENARQAAPLEELNLKIAHQELEALEKSTPLSLDNARRTKMESEQDLAYYEDVSKAMRQRDAKENVRRIEQSLSYSQEELKQLEKMYEADDLTEETEEIILQRARNDVEYYEWLLEQTKARSERTLDTVIPREHDTQRRNVTHQQLAWRQAERSIPDALRKKKLEVDQQERSRKKAAERLAGLEKDLSSLTVKAPHDGIVYYGSAKRGKWITAATVDRKLIPGGKLMPRENFITLVKPSPVVIKVAVPETKLRHLKPGLRGFASPAWDAEAEFKTQLKEISFVPFADGTYDAVFTVPKADNDGPQIFPGMNAKVRLDLYEAADALTAPRKGVHKDAEGHYVHLKDGTKRRVKVGKSNESVYEILSGLKEGDEIKVP